MSSKVDLLPIVKDHFRTLVNEATGKPSAHDYLLFYGLPLLTAIVTASADLRLRGVDGILSAMSILVGLLLNLLVLMFAQADSLSRLEATDMRGLRTRLIRETHANATYAMLVGLLVVGCLGLAAFTDTDALPRWASAAGAFLTLHFLLTLALVIKRVRAAFLSRFL